eukprot:s628_g9.t1
MCKRIDVGDRVGFRILNVFGTVKFFGATEFAAGNWVGLDLDLPVGTSDGEVRGKRYFACGPGRGVFARPAALKRVDGDIRRLGDVAFKVLGFGKAALPILHVGVVGCKQAGRGIWLSEDG